MTEKRAYILVFVVAALLQIALTIGLKLLNAESDAFVLAYLLLACGASLSIGLIGTHYN
ncbi:MAG TPA: hypothetical protein VN179_04900 [Solirubrobacterales bacterium]|jgi:hypothetical protein|nr:hypothetical protein [Solirubrobacterales bacterium]